MNARFYFAVASNDDKQEPAVKDVLRAPFAKAKVRAEVQVFPDALHGWCVPDSKAYSYTAAVQLAWEKTMALLKDAL
jgi:carboxymethylenebutenolidase